MTGSRTALIVLVLLGVPAGAALSGIPPGYYDPAAGLSGETLRAALHGIIDDHDSISYDEIWLAFYTTDDRSDGYVWDMYSDIPGGTPPYLYTFGEDEGGSASSEGEGYNREHSWPKSWFGDQAPMNTDLFHIIPTDIYVNNRRGNYPFGEVASPSWVSLNGSRLGPCSWPGYTGTAFEPRDDFKGDLARNCFYMTTRYYGEDASWPGSPMTDGAQLLPWAEDMLIAWHLGDPVSTKELDRNEAVFDIQSNRNPFIDHPEYVLMIYDPMAIEDPGRPSAVLEAGASPTPFACSVGISFTLASPSIVDVMVYDASGRLVSPLMDDAGLPAGACSMSWDGCGQGGEDLPNGVYFCRISTQSDEAVCTMLLLR